MFQKAYRFYVEGLSLVAEVLKKDLAEGQSLLTLRDKCNLIKFAKQSLGRVTGLLGEKGKFSLLLSVLAVASSLSI